MAAIAPSSRTLFATRLLGSAGAVGPTGNCESTEHKSMRRPIPVNSFVRSFRDFISSIFARSAKPPLSPPFHPFFRGANSTFGNVTRLRTGRTRGRWQPCRYLESWQIVGKMVFGQTRENRNSENRRVFTGFMVGLGGLEPPTLPLSG